MVLMVIRTRRLVVGEVIIVQNLVDILMYLNHTKAFPWAGHQPFTTGLRASSLQFSFFIGQ